MNNGGHAFPMKAFETRNGQGFESVIQNGMTLRDYFAAQAMQSFVLNKNILFTEAAELSYKMADAMIKERAL